MIDVLIKNAKIVDGTGSPWFWGDIGILGENIVSIKHKINVEARNIIDCNGFVASPGFIDMHSHSDMRVLKYPEEDQKLMQGVTTDLLGQDGLSLAPIDDKNLILMKKRISGLLGTYIENWTWRSVDQYLSEIEKVKPGDNKMMLIPYSSIRAMALGWEDRPSTAEELEKMKELLNQAFTEGACGLSMGLIYPPAMYANQAEMEELLRVTGKNGGFFVVHMRNESDNIIEALHEVINACKKSECPLHISHLKIAGKRNWGQSQEVLSIIDKARNEGLDVTFDQYPYVAGSTMLDAVIPPWYHKGGQEKLLERLKDPKTREQIRHDQAGDSKSFVNVVANSGGWGGIFISSVRTEKNKFAEGKSIQQIAIETGKTPLDAVADLLIEEDGAATMINFYGDEGDLEKIMQHPCMCACTDGIVGGKPHPRAYGSYPRILGRYVRERKIMSLEAAVQKMTANPARRLNLQNRGILKEGMKGDITIFDPDTIIDVGTFSQPNQYPKGITYVFVNGHLAMENGRLTEDRWGKVLRFKA